MKFNVGDKVKFLNEPGGGIITKIISPGLVNVAIEEGFDIPTLTSNLLKMEDSGYSGKMFDQDFDVDVEAERPAEKESQASVRGSRITRKRSGQKQAEGVYLAFIPRDQKWLVTGDIDLQVLNHSGYDILYNLYLKKDDGRYAGIDYGSLGPESAMSIEIIPRDALDQWLTGHIQILFHSEDKPGAILPVHREFNLKASRFMHEGSYTETGLLDEKAILLPAGLISETQKLTQDPVRKKFDQGGSKLPNTTAKKPPSLISKHRTSEREAVVDLHIAELTGNIAGMSSSDMLNLQTQYFERTLESAILEKYRKVTYIHGVGNGTLKNAIMEKIKDYEGLENYDASLAKFGVGAVDIIIRYNA